MWQVKDKSADSASTSFREFLGTPVDEDTFRIVSLHTDSSPELIKAARDLKLFHDTTAPGVPQANGIIERQVRFVLEGARTVMEHAGMPPRLWPEACRYVCMARRIAIVDGNGIWKTKFARGNFTGNLLCFGQLVSFMPARIKDKHKDDKW